MVTRWSLGAARGFPGGFGEQNECFRNGVFGPLAPREGVWGVPTSIIVRNLTPSGARLAGKVSRGDNLAPFSSDKIRAKSARILSAAITRPILLPAGVRGTGTTFT